MRKRELEKFLLKARAKTYVAAKGKLKPALPGSVQYEYKDGDYSYRDVYYLGNSIFPGLETVFFKAEAVWSMSYFGDFSSLTEQQTDTFLRRALLEFWKDTRIYNRVEKDYGSFRYICEGAGTIDKLSGEEMLYVGAKKVCSFSYKGGYVGEEN